jgi:hypothetical protein
MLVVHQRQTNSYWLSGAHRLPENLGLPAKRDAVLHKLITSNWTQPPVGSRHGGPCPGMDSGFYPKA